MLSKISKPKKINKSAEQEVDTGNKSATNVVKKSKVKYLSTKNTGLTTRTINCLLANGIDTIERLRQLNLAEFRTKKNVGGKTIDEIKACLGRLGISSKAYVELSNKIATGSPEYKYDDMGISAHEVKEIDERIFKVKIKDLDLSKKLIKAIESNNVFTLEDFINNRPNIVLKAKELELVYKEVEKFGINRTDYYKPVTVKTPKNYFLNIEAIFDDEWIINACKRHELRNVGLLANVFPAVFVQDDELASQEIFFDKVASIENKFRELGITKTPIALSYFQKKELLKRDDSELFNKNYVELLKNLIFETLDVSNRDPELKKCNRGELSEKEVDIISKRYGLGVEKQTLDEIGQIYSCSRERIRQLELKAVTKIVNCVLPKFSKMDDEILQLLDGLGSIICCKNSENSDIDELLKMTLARFEDRHFDVNFDCNVVVKRGLQLEDIYKKLLKSYDGTGFYYLSKIERDFDELLLEYVHNSSEVQNFNYLGVHKRLFPIFLANNFSKIDENLYKYISTEDGKRTKRGRDEKLIYWFEKLYPKGVHLPIEKEKEYQLIESFQPLFAKCEEIKGLGIRSVADRLIKNNSDVIWWGRGLYIHINNVKVNWDVVDSAIDEVIRLFDSGLNRIKPSAIFDRDREKYIDAGIPNELALVGVIKYRNNPRLNIHRDELRDNESSNLDRNILQAFESFIQQYPEGIRKKELMNEMCNKRGRQRHQVEFLYNRSDKIYNDNGIYLHSDNFTIDESKLQELIDIIRAELNECELPFVHLRKFKSAYPEIWYGVINRDISPNFMGRLISPRITDKDFTIDNYVYVKKIELYGGSTTLNAIVEQFAKAKSMANKTLTFSEVFDYCKKQGLIYLRHSISGTMKKFCLEYVDNAYVHYDVIGYTAAFQEKINALIKILSENKFDSPLIKYDDVINNYKDLLPVLNKGYEWNSCLLRGLLKKEENINTFYKAFVFKGNSFGIEKLDEIAAYLMLKKHRNGCSTKDLDKLMVGAGVIPVRGLRLCKSRLFFEGSSVRTKNNDKNVVVEQFAIDKYLNLLDNQQS